MMKILVSLIAVFWSLSALATGERVALVIGNADYKKAPLINPVNDAKDMAVKLQSLGFTVITRTNLNTKQIGGALREFKSKLKPGSVALVYYAGHGIQIKGENYLPAVDAEITSEEDVPYQSISIKQIMDVLDESKSRLNLVFLDACRNNPYARSFRSGSGDGLARFQAPSGTIISYATRPGSVAADGKGRNGLYTEYLLKAMDLSNEPIEQALKTVVREVRSASKGAQEPWMEGSIDGDFYFKLDKSVKNDTKIASVQAPVKPTVIKDSSSTNNLNELYQLYVKGRGIENIEPIKDQMFKVNSVDMPIYFYIDTNTGSKEDYYIFPQSITQLPNNRLVFNLLAKTSRKLLIFDFSKESILRVALDCNTKSGSLYQKGDIDAASKKIVNEVFFGNPEFMPLQQISIGTVFDHLFTQICDPARRINIVQKFEVRSPLWTVAMNLDNAKSVYLNRNFVFRVNNYADVVLKTENVIAENLPYIDKPIKTMIQRYRIDCPSQMMEIDSDFLAEDLSLLSKFTSYGTNAKQKMLPNSTGELAYSLGCK